MIPLDRARLPDRRAALVLARLWDSGLRQGAAPRPPLRPDWARASTDQGGGLHLRLAFDPYRSHHVQRSPGRVPGRVPAPILALPGGVPTKLHRRSLQLSRIKRHASVVNVPCGLQRRHFSIKSASTDLARL
jgi:hypothetical protein